MNCKRLIVVLYLLIIFIPILSVAYSISAKKKAELIEVINYIRTREGWSKIKNLKIFLDPVNTLDVESITKDEINEENFTEKVKQLITLLGCRYAQRLHAFWFLVDGFWQSCNNYIKGENNNKLDFACCVMELYDSIRALIPMMEHIVKGLTFLNMIPMPKKDYFFKKFRHFAMEIKSSLGDFTKIYPNEVFIKDDIIINKNLLVLKNNHIYVFINKLTFKLYSLNATKFCHIDEHFVTFDELFIFYVKYIKESTTSKNVAHLDKSLYLKDFHSHMNNYLKRFYKSVIDKEYNDLGINKLEPVVMTIRKRSLKSDTAETNKRNKTDGY